MSDSNLKTPSRLMIDSLIQQGHELLLAGKYENAIAQFTKAEIRAGKSKNRDQQILALMGLMMAYCESRAGGVANSLSNKLELLLASGSPV